MILQSGFSTEDAAPTTAADTAPKASSDRWDTLNHFEPGLLGAALEAATCAMMITDAAGTIRWVNDAFTALTGFRLDEVLGRSPRVLKSGHHDAAFYSGMWSTISSGRVWTGEFVNRRKDGSVYHEECAITPVKGRSGNVTHFIATKHDISERRQAGQRLRGQADLLELTRDAVSIRDLSGRILYWNRGAEDLFGWSAAEVVDKLPAQRDISLTSTALEKALASTLETGHWSGELERTPKQGRHVVTQTRCTLVKDTSGRAESILVVDTDITEKVKIQTQFLKAQRMEAIGQLASGVAHDFNNLLAVIRGHTELLLMRPEALTPQVTDHLNEINTAAERAANLTRQLLTFSRKQVMVPERINLNELIGSFSKMLHRIIGEHIQLKCDGLPDVPMVMADTGMLEQVIMNLVVNARDAMPDGGELKIDTGKRLLAPGQSPGAERREGEFVTLSVIDTGTGIPPENLTRIFEPFFTTKEVGKGTGLGLATAYGIAKQHRGWIEVKSEVGTGSTFTLFLPAAQEGEPANVSQPKPPALRGGSECILLVEDEAPVRLISKKVLEAYGYRVLEASSAQEAMELWEAHAEEVDLLLTDIVLPCGVSGPELAQRVRAKKPDLRVLLMSGYSQEDANKNLAHHNLSNCQFLPKAGSTRALIEAVRRCLD